MFPGSMMRSREKDGEKQKKEAERLRERKSSRKKEMKMIMWLFNLNTVCNTYLQLGVRDWNCEVMRGGWIVEGSKKGWNVKMKNLFFLLLFFFLLFWLNALLHSKVSSLLEWRICWKGLPEDWACCQWATETSWSGLGRIRNKVEMCGFVSWWNKTRDALLLWSAPSYQTSEEGSHSLTPPPPVLSAVLLPF